MRRYWLPLALSIIVHGMLTRVLVPFFCLKSGTAVVRVRLIPQPAARDDPSPEASKPVTPPPLMTAEASEKSLSDDQPPAPEDSNSPAAAPGWHDYERRMSRRQTFMDRKTEPPEARPWDSWSAENPSVIRRDPVQEWLNREFPSASAAPSFSGSGVEGASTEPRFDFTPTRAQVQALNYLTHHDRGTQLDLYRYLDPNLPITADGFDLSLEQLVQKGFVTRKKISPQHLFVIGAAFVAVPIEMSSKNRKNPVYEYRIKVDRQQLIQYLQSRIYRLQQSLTSSPPDSTRLAEIRELEIRLQILIQEEPSPSPPELF